MIEKLLFHAHLEKEHNSMEHPMHLAVDLSFESHGSTCCAGKGITPPAQSKHPYNHVTSTRCDPTELMVLRAAASVNPITLS